MPVKKLLFLLPVLLLCSFRISAQTDDNPTYFRMATQRTFNVISTRQHDKASIKEVTYKSPRGHKVLAWLVEPLTPGPHKALIYRHSENNNKDRFLNEAIYMATQGYVCLLPEAPWMRAENRRKSVVEDARYFYELSLSELNKGCDVLAEHATVDSSRMAFIGHGLGAQMGAQLGVRSGRLKALVLVAGTPSTSTMMLESRDRYWKKMRDSIPDVVERVSAEMAPFDADRFMARVKMPVFHQFGSRDTYVSYAMAHRFYDLTSGPRQMRFYQGGHELNEQALSDRSEWLTRVLDATPQERALQALPDYFATQLPLHYPLPDSTQYHLMTDRLYSREAGGRLLDFYKPAHSQPNQPFPVIVLLHGQDHPALMSAAKDRPALAGLAKVLAARGYLVIVPNLGSSAAGPGPNQRLANLPQMASNTDSVLQYIRTYAEGLNANLKRVGFWSFADGAHYGMAPAIGKWQKQVKVLVASYPSISDEDLEAQQPPLQVEQRKQFSALYQMVDTDDLQPTLILQPGQDSKMVNLAIDNFEEQAEYMRLPVSVIRYTKGHHRFESVDATNETHLALNKAFDFFDLHLKRRKERKKALERLQSAPPSDAPTESALPPQVRQ